MYGIAFYNLSCMQHMSYLSNTRGLKTGEMSDVDVQHLTVPYAGAASWLLGSRHFMQLCKT